MFTLKDLFENPDKRFWECDAVEPDPVMVELVARAKANPEKPGQSAFIERARKLMYEAINKRGMGARGLPNPPNPFYFNPVRVYRVVCSKCGRKIPLPTYVTTDKHKEMLSDIPPCSACGAQDSWIIEEVK